MMLRALPTPPSRLIFRFDHTGGQRILHHIAQTCQSIGHLLQTLMRQPITRMHEYQFCTQRRMAILFYIYFCLLLSNLLCWPPLLCHKLLPSGFQGHRPLSGSVGSFNGEFWRMWQRRMLLALEYVFSKRYFAPTGFHGML